AQGGHDGSRLLFGAPVWQRLVVGGAAQGPAALPLSHGELWPKPSPGKPPGGRQDRALPQPVDPPRDDWLGGGDRPGAARLAVGGRPVRRQQAPEGGGRMKQGVILCGLNGSGKSTLGRALAQRLGWEFLDIEDCFFPKTDPSYLYANPRSPQEAAALLVERATAAENFVLTSVKGHYPGLAPLLTGAVWLRVDKATRARRVRQRSYEKFGERMGPGGDLFQQEEA